MSFECLVSSPCSLTPGAALRFPPGGGLGLSQFLFRTRPKHHEDFSDQLHGTGIEGLADPLERVVPAVSIVAQHPDLDELMALQREVDFLEHCVGQTGAADHHDRVQGVGS